MSPSFLFAAELQSAGADLKGCPDGEKYENDVEQAEHGLEEDSDDTLAVFLLVPFG